MVPLIEKGFVDWIVSTGANLYHDTHFAMGHTLHRGTPFVDDRILRERGVIRIYDILFDYDVLVDTDDFFRQVVRMDEFQKEMGTAELHHRLGRYVAEREKILKLGHKSILSAAYEYDVPVYTSSPGDSSIGMNIAEVALSGYSTKIDVLLDVNESASIVLGAKAGEGEKRSADLRGRISKELPTSDRAADSGGLENQRKGARLLHSDHRCSPGYRRAFWSHAG